MITLRSLAIRYRRNRLGNQLLDYVGGLTRIFHSCYYGFAVASMLVPKLVSNEFPEINLHRLEGFFIALKPFDALVQVGNSARLGREASITDNPFSPLPVALRLVALAA